MVSMLICRSSRMNTSSCRQVIGWEKAREPTRQGITYAIGFLPLGRQSKVAGISSGLPIVEENSRSNRIQNGQQPLNKFSLLPHMRHRCLPAITIAEEGRHRVQPVPCMKKTSHSSTLPTADSTVWS
jgi:hypothetical protein